ncbi:hypothetical protein GCM10007198_05740 [Microbacterium aerolatum]|uniref:Uncharacterized protein n=1 Tax=Microbacterium aerolatum TaxID=153731 RepID=A0A511AEJ3_9MICO|nr:hypothetical protein MAE01_17560 [Microbacterium aerolatum]GGB18046.1 hypothetical protein GCM10007198_05740 [Microbacterium aerolatum]
MGDGGGVFVGSGVELADQVEDAAAVSVPTNTAAVLSAMTMTTRTSVNVRLDGKECAICDS